MEKKFFFSTMCANSHGFRRMVVQGLDWGFTSFVFFLLEMLCEIGLRTLFKGNLSIFGQYPRESHRKANTLAVENLCYSGKFKRGRESGQMLSHNNGHVQHRSMRRSEQQQKNKISVAVLLEKATRNPRLLQKSRLVPHYLLSMSP